METALKALVIFNPPAGTSETQALRDALSRHFAAPRIEFAIYDTRKGDPLADIVRTRLRDGFDIAVAHVEHSRR